jgi:hypothetical protein
LPSLGLLNIRYTSYIAEHSPILFLLYIRNIYSLEIEGAYSLSYIDDFAIIVTLNLAKSNCKKLEEIALELIYKLYSVKNYINDLIINVALEPLYIYKKGANNKGVID